MNATSKARLSKVHPALAQKIVQLSQILFTHNVDIEVVQGLRTYAEQNALFAQGRTKPGKRVTNARGGHSLHNFGVAVDVAPAKRGKIDWDDEEAFDVIGREAKKLGLEWGGDWRGLVDRPHVQLPSLSVGVLRTLYDKGGLPEVWKSIKTDGGAVPSSSPQPLVTDSATEEAATDQPEKGTTTGDNSPEQTAGTPPPAPAVEVKASGIPFLTRLASLSIPAGVVSAVGGIIAFAKELPPYAWVSFSVIVVAAMVIGYLIYRDSKNQAHERTKIVLAAAADRDKNNLRLV